MLKLITRGSIALAVSFISLTVDAQSNSWRSPSDPQNRYNGAATNTTTSSQNNYRTAAKPNPAIAPINSNTASFNSNTPVGNLKPIGQSAPTQARVTKGSGSLPNNSGQVWREYDIRPFTLRNQEKSRPEQVIVDWILRETGYETWHSDPVGLLSANKQKVTVYHTPEMQNIVAGIIDRFIQSQTKPLAFSLRIATVKSPNWRARALPLMKPIPVQSPGVQAWILAKEDAAVLLGELKRRGDYREHNSAQQLIASGQSMLISTMRPRNYMKGVTITQATWPGYQPTTGQLQEGFSLEFSPLQSLDKTTVDAVVKLQLNQVEKMIPVMLEVPTAVAQNQRTQIEVPQMIMSNLHERFRWPADQVLLLSLGVVASPAPRKTNPLLDNPLMSKLQISMSAPRSDALLIIESKGYMTSNPPTGSGVPATASRAPTSFHGRY